MWQGTAAAAAPHQKVLQPAAAELSQVADLSFWAHKQCFRYLDVAEQADLTGIKPVVQVHMH